ncbi:MAG: DUF4132 domain-containing protein [Flavobacteriales bacterium]|nr:DUF4132 domain-containing protein [Flavobacteriales bacterium]
MLSTIFNKKAKAKDYPLMPKLDEFVKEAKKLNTYFYGAIKMPKESYAQIKALNNKDKIEMLFFLVPEIDKFTQKSRKMTNSYKSEEYIRSGCYMNLLKALMRTKLEFSQEELIGILKLLRECSTDDYSANRFTDWPQGFLAVQFEKFVKKNGTSEELKSFLLEVLEWPELQSNNNYWGSDMSKVRQKFVALAHGQDDGEAPPFYLAEDALGKHINQEVKSLDNAYYGLLNLASTASGSKPSKKFLKQAKELLEKIGHQKAKTKIHGWMQFVIDLDQTWEYYQFLPPENMKVIKGLVWGLSNYHDSKTLSIVSKLAERCSRKIPGVGPAAPAITNACIFTLANSKGLEGISHLSRLRLRISQNNTKRLIQSKLDEAAQKLGISPDEVEEMAAPDFDLVNGRIEAELGEFKFEILVKGIGDVAQTWYKADGSIQKTAPSSVKSDKRLAEKLKKLKAKAKSIKSALTTQRDRIDRSYLSSRTWTFENWQKFYLDHGLVSCIAKKLIWKIEKGQKQASIFLQNDEWIDPKGNTVDWVDEAETISLWHPATVHADEVLDWRNYLMERQIIQPLKQAYREVYLLTDAEVNTRFYSNRMAAHILKQHQFNALAGLRGWKYQLLGWYDDGRDGDVAQIKIPNTNIRAEFWINEVHEDEAFNDAGIWNYIATDQVRFTDPNGDPIDLVDIDRLIFSEIMRDVDLFVGVCSVGNDPNWQDNGGLAQYRDYWTSYSFGNLNEIAKTRKQVLEKLIPRLKIKDVTTIDGKFVKVQGKKRTYKIHIGSSNILMEPNDQYLCIVPARGKADTGKVFLPFDGDRGLSLVLSKAMLLADDDKIKDPTILSQINS